MSHLLHRFTKVSSMALTTTESYFSLLRAPLLGLAVLSVVLQTGCLDTRTAVKEQEEKFVLRKQVANLQQTSADVNSRFQDIEDELRRVNGRVETVENRVQQVTAKEEKSQAANETRLKERDDIYREEFNRLHAELAQLKTTIATFQEEQSRVAQAKAAQAAQAAANPFAAAEEKFENKNYREAILDYEKYRRANPKGKQFAAATYKIGVAFAEMGMPEDGKAFFEEVIAKFPKSKEADKAAAKIKAMKKK